LVQEVSTSKDNNNLFLKSSSECFAALLKTALNGLAAQTLLFEAFFVALSLHVLFVPVLWVLGWALPWPKSPTITTIIEYDLRGWPNVVKSKKILDFRDPRRN
jgi:hypothetical protein